ncbi:MAG TPA: hypothetical protein VL551_10325 [Actinospica sp.]|nr:hypothetical protein [Actinospica sp.]
MHKQRHVSRLPFEGEVGRDFAESRRRADRFLNRENRSTETYAIEIHACQPQDEKIHLALCPRSRMCETGGDMSPKKQPEPPAPEGGAPELGLLATRLEHLIATVHPRNRGPYTNEEIAEGVNKKAGWQATSTTGIWQLRKGARRGPEYPRIVAIANFFGVKPEYFYDDDVARNTDDQLEVLAAMRDKDVRDIAMRSSKLSQHSLKGIRAMIDAAYTLEGIEQEDAEE